MFAGQTGSVNESFGERSLSLAPHFRSPRYLPEFPLAGIQHIDPKSEVRYSMAKDALRYASCAIKDHVVSDASHDSGKNKTMFQPE